MELLSEMEVKISHRITPIKILFFILLFSCTILGTALFFFYPTTEKLAKKLELTSRFCLAKNRQEIYSDAIEAIETLSKRNNPRATLLLIQTSDLAIDFFPNVAIHASEKLIGRTDPNIISALIQLSENNKIPEVSYNATIALTKINDPKVVEPILRKAIYCMTNNCPTGLSTLIIGIGKNQQTFEKLIEFIESGQDEFIDLALEALGHSGRFNAADAIAQFITPCGTHCAKAGNALVDLGARNYFPQIIRNMKVELQDWDKKDHAVYFLTERLNWEPESDEDKVFLWVALKDGQSLIQNWETTRNVLIDKIMGNSRISIKYGVYALLGIGHDAAIPDLERALSQHGTKLMANTFLNSGNTKLTEAARKWADRNGYSIHRDSYGPDTEGFWGEFNSKN